MFYIKNLIPLKNIFNYLWFGQDFLSRSGQFFGVSWSLCIEEWFYLTFPLVLFVLSRIMKNKNYAFISTSVVFIIVCFLIRFVLEKNDVSSVRLITLARLDAIAMGVLTSFMVVRFGLSYKRSVFLFFGGVGLIFIGYIQILFEGYFNFYVLAYIPFGFSIILPFLSSLKPLHSNFNWVNRSIENISLWSYSIYLCHIPVLFITYELLDPWRSNIVVNIFSKILALFLVIALSAIVFKKFELPLTKYRPNEIN